MKVLFKVFLHKLLLKMEMESERNSNYVLTRKIDLSTLVNNLKTKKECRWFAQMNGIY